MRVSGIALVAVIGIVSSTACSAAGRWYVDHKSRKCMTSGFTPEQSLDAAKKDDPSCTMETNAQKVSTITCPKINRKINLYPDKAFCEKVLPVNLMLMDMGR